MPFFFDGKSKNDPILKVAVHLIGMVVEYFEYMLFINYKNYVISLVLAVTGILAFSGEAFAGKCQTQKCLDDKAKLESIHFI